MASESVLEFTEQNFENEVLESDQPVLVDFWAEWCMPCRMIAPIIDDVAREFTGRAKVGKVDVDSNRELALKYNIQNIPTVLVFKGGDVVKKFVGMANKQQIADAITAAG